jgi:hypothetical protein
MLTEIRELAIQRGINLVYDKVQIIEGWRGKPKGLPQICGKEAE